MYPLSKISGRGISWRRFFGSVTSNFSVVASRVMLWTHLTVSVFLVFARSVLFFESTRMLSSSRVAETVVEQKLLFSVPSWDYHDYVWLCSGFYDARGFLEMAVGGSSLSINKRQGRSKNLWVGAYERCSRALSRSCFVFSSICQICIWLLPVMRLSLNLFLVCTRCSVPIFFLGGTLSILLSVACLFRSVRSI